MRNLVRKSIFQYLIRGILYVVLLSSPAFGDDITLQWVSAATNADGSPLTDCAGTRIFHSLVSGQYSMQDMREVDCTVTQYIWQNLGTGTHYFVAVHFDYATNQSSYSNEVNKIITYLGTPQPDLTIHDSVSPVDDQQILFGDVSIGNYADETLSIANDGNADLIIGNIGAGYQLRYPFSIVHDACSGQTIIPSSQCTVTIRFSPSSGGTYNENISVPSNDPDEGSVTVYISGSGTPLAVADISVIDPLDPADDLQIPFGNVTVFLSDDQTITITNTGNAGLDIYGIAGSDPVSTPFSIHNDSCSGQTVNPDSACSFVVHFEPVTEGNFYDSFSIVSNDTDEGTLTVTVTGTGLPSERNNPPDTPALLYPKDGQRGLGQTVDFRWRKARDPDGDPITYDLLLCEDQNFTINCVSQSYIKASYMNGNVYYAGFLAFPGSLIILTVIILAGIVTRGKITQLLIIILIIASFFFISCGGGSSEGTGGVIVTRDSSQNVSDDEITYSVSGLTTGIAYFWTVIARDSNGSETSGVTWHFDTN